jgi:DNA-binding GntR family transcriptional regulator
MTEIPRRGFWSSRVARVRPARLLTILSGISRIVPVRGREDTTSAQVGKAAGTPLADTPLGRAPLAGTRQARTPLAGTRQARTPLGETPLGGTRQARTPLGETPLGETRQAGIPRAGTPVAGAAGRRLAGGRLRQAILAGDLSHGQRLIEAELAELFGVTRASLRAALFDLTADGLVERIPNRGARVRTVTLDEAVAITECRMVLEGLCAAKAAERVTGSQAARLGQLGEQMQRSVADGEPLKYSALNHELHRLVREISGQSAAAGLIERLNGQLVRHQFQLALRPGRPRASLGEHMAIIVAITGRRPDEAEQAMRRHLRSVMRALLDHHQPGYTRGTGEPVIMNDDQVAGTGEAATSTVSPYETVP